MLKIVYVHHIDHPGITTSHYIERTFVNRRSAHNVEGYTESFVELYGVNDIYGSIGYMMCADKELLINYLKEFYADLINNNNRYIAELKSDIENFKHQWKN